MITLISTIFGVLSSLLPNIVNIFQKKISEDWGPAIERMSFSVLNYLKGIENG